MNLAELRKEHDEVVKSIFAISDEATKENRALTDEEHTKATELFTKAKDLKEQIAKAEDKEDLRERIKTLGMVTPEDVKPTPSGAKGSLGDQFVNSEGYKSLIKNGLKGGNWSTGAIELDPAQAKATLTTDAASGGDLIQPDTQAGVQPILFRRLTVADLLPSGNTDSNVVRYLKETTATNAAATVAEGAAKPESTLIFDAVDEPVRKIATWLPVTDEMLEDYQQIRAYVDNRLRLFVQLTEEDQLLNGNGTAPNLTGILNRTGLQTQALGTDSRADAIFKAANLVRINAFLEPDSLVIHPNDWQDVRLEKNANGDYYAGGPFSAQPGMQPPLWGLTVVVTPAIAAGTALVGAFRQAAQVFRKGGITVEASNSHSDFFVTNKTAIRAEERLALAVYRPAAFASVTGI